jgi:hypothetical protein
MTSTISPPFPTARHSNRGEPGASPRADRMHMRRNAGARDVRLALDRYTDAKGRLREVVTLPGLAGSVLVVDRDAVTLGERRLVAHLAADEPAENAVLVCSRYLEDARRRRVSCRCRRVTPMDLARAPFADEEAELRMVLGPDESNPVDRRGRSYRLELLATGMSIPELRWRRHPPEGGADRPTLVSVREAIACLESYEPVRTLTLRALLSWRGDPGFSVTILRAELERVQTSPIVLNRRLRQTVLATIEWQGLSMSEIAVRCGRVKRDSKGKASGETSWLARRVGILPESGGNTPTPWIHSDVLALIARCGLGISPREVEVG